jgi:hypothetical protein
MSAERAARGTAWWRNPGCLLAIAVVVLMVSAAGWIYFAFYQGRDISRITGVPVKIEMPDCVRSVDQVVSVSFHDTPQGETIKDLTYICDGKLFSHEYNDFGIMPGRIEWAVKGQ